MTDIVQLLFHMIPSVFSKGMFHLHSATLHILNPRMGITNSGTLAFRGGRSYELGLRVSNRSRIRVEIRVRVQVKVRVRVRVASG